MKQAMYQNIYDDIKSFLLSGKYSAGNRIDTEPQMAKKYGVSIGTVRKSIDYLVKEDLLRREQGRGTYVSENINIVVPLGEKIKLAHAITLVEQSKIDHALYGNDDNITSFSVLPTFFSTRKEFDLSGCCDLIQMSTIQLHSGNTQSFFEAVPSHLLRKILPFFKEQLLDEFRSHDGQVLALPVTANMSVLYANEIHFDNAGIDIPHESLSLNMLIELCRALKKRYEFPIALFPAIGCLYEPLMNMCGCVYFDKYGEVSLEWEPFSRMMDFLKTLHSEKLCVNVYKIGSSYPTFIKNEKVCMVFSNQIFNHQAGNCSFDWHVLPLPHEKFQSGCYTSIGVGVCKFSQNKKSAWSMLEQVFDQGIKRFSTLKAEFPARLDLQTTWAGAQVKDKNNFAINLDLSEPIPARKGISTWHSELYNVFQNAMEGNITVKNAWNNAKKILNKNQNGSVFNEAV